MTISPFKPGSLCRARSADLFVSMRRDMAELQRQLVTGQKADTFGGLGFERRTSLDARAKTLGHRRLFPTSSARPTCASRMMTQNLERLAKLGADTKSDLALSKFELLSDGRTFAQKNAEQRLQEAIDLLTPTSPDALCSPAGASMYRLSNLRTASWMVTVRARPD